MNYSRTWIIHGQESRVSYNFWCRTKSIYLRGECVCVWGGGVTSNDYNGMGVPPEF